MVHSTTVRWLQVRYRTAEIEDRAVAGQFSSWTLDRNAKVLGGVGHPAVVADQGP